MAHVRCKTNNNILLFYPFVQDANDSFVPCFAFVLYLVLCIMTSAVPLFYMDRKPKISILTPQKGLERGIGGSVRPKSLKKCVKFY